MQYLSGVLSLRVPTFRELAEDPNATRTAAVIVALVSLVVGFVNGIVLEAPPVPPHSIVVGGVFAIVGVVIGLVAWFISAWVLSVVARWFGGRTNVNQMLRVTGFVEIFNLVMLVNLLVLVAPWLGFLSGIALTVGGLLHVIGYLLGVREAAKFSTGNAIVTAIVAAIANIVIVFLGLALVALPLALLVATGSGQ